MNILIRVDLSVILSKLGNIHKLALEQASTLCISRGNSEVGILHLLYALLDSPLNDVRILMGDLDFDIDNLKQKIARHIPSEVVEEDIYPAFSPLLVNALQDAWLLSTTELDQSELRSGALFLAILIQIERYLPLEFKTLFSQINRESFRQNFTVLLQKSSENSEDNQINSLAKTQLLATESNLNKYTIDVTLQAERGQLDPVLGRDEEIYLMIDILSRRRKNNPIVVGDAGVGKSALIEGLAQKISAGNVPLPLQGVRLLMLDLGLLQAGASIKGEFEKRLKGVIDEVRASDTPIILFVDEAHTLIGAGNSEGGADAANLLKPALARGELRTIAATTWREYKKYFEKDPALSRRFQLVMVEEPSVESAVGIMRGLRTVYEKAHNVLITDCAIRAAVTLSDRYLTGRQLPDKAIDVLDTACARVAINLNVPPLKLTKLKNSLNHLKLEKELLERALLLGEITHEKRHEKLLEEELILIQKIDTLESDWQDQKLQVANIIALRDKALQEDDASLKEALILDFAAEKTVLNALDSDNVLVYSAVDEQQISAVISDWTGIPINKMDRDDLVKMTELPLYLEEHIKGQRLAINKIHQRLLTTRADLHKVGRPQGAFLLVGPSGVGKTETAIQIADLLYGGRAFLTTINMSEYQEKHTVSRLIGSPPGYIGYGEGGVLTEAIRQKPYSIVLLDEVEKAHPEVLNIFYQAFDKGEIIDGEGRLINCQNILFLMTSNLGYQTIVEYHEQPEKLADLLYQDLLMFFQPALLARMEVVPYVPLSESVVREIIDYKLGHLQKSLETRYAANIELSNSLTEAIQSKLVRAENGARMIESIIEGELLPSLSLQILQKLSKAESITEIKLDVVNDNFESYVS